MKENLRSNKISAAAGFGVTGALLTGSFTLSVCAVTNRGLFAFLICCALCFVFSIKNKDRVFAPHPFLLLPLFFALSGGSALAGGLAIAGGGLLYLAIAKLIKDEPIPDFVASGMGLGVAVGVTILLTNTYFGIGADSYTPLEMLKEFRSLGFHPNFRGLFYGTITLFAMITFPFKFKKLNRYLPAAFITLLIPFIFNLFLNPQKELTTINEAASLVVPTSLKDEISTFIQISADDIPYILKGAVGFGAILYVLANGSSTDGFANCTTGTLTGIPVKAHTIKGYGLISAIVSIAVVTAPVLLCPGIFSRLPLHCAGSMLIVCAWQSLPITSLKNLFKERNLIKILLMVLCAVPFVITDVSAAAIIAFVLWVIFGRAQRKGAAK